MEVITDLLPVKRDNSGRPVIPISIGMVDFLEALCDFGSSVNIMPKEILKNLGIRVGTLYAPANFVVIETGTDERAPILGRPFLNTSGAVIYASAAKISFYIKGRNETFSFKNKITQISEQSRHEPRKRINRWNRNKQMWTESAKMVTAAQGGQDRQLKSSFLIKKDDPSMPSIQCSTNGYNFQKMLCDIGSGVNIMAAVTYQLLFGTMPLKPTYIKLQMADQTFRKVEGDRSSALLKQSSTLEPEKSTCTSPLRRYAAILLTLTIKLKTLSRSGQEDDDATATRGGKSSRTDG